MNFDDVKRIEKPMMTFIPVDILYTFSHFLKMYKPDGIEYKITPWRKIQQNEKLRKKYRPYQEKTQKAFRENGCDKDVVLFSGFTSNIDPEYLFEKLKSFYGPTIDPEVKAWMKSNAQVVKDEEPVVQPDSIVLSITDERIRVIGEFEKLQKLQHLIETKSLSQEDLILILTNLQWVGL